MSALLKIREEGFDVILFGDAFKVSPANELTTKQREFLKRHKAEIINALQNQGAWIELPDPGALTVTCYTPDGKPIEVPAASPEHAEQLRLWNPKLKHRSSSEA
ncbi:conserved hypothetical protein [Candidatus Methylobacter favarea]|uniref:TubC N-terminal docking domain-containing protein n=1 Tax=Candidatus Methylobacter favarea TaxID=2707345 RepID=A0A8S0WYM6_9GAMM|nr:hypothetical protein [Candidatus Methylobacter favarea]CAA9889643.1 conserved hypothetical protein [Candidatus Methylobacter favarea]